MDVYFNESNQILIKEFPLNIYKKEVLFKMLNLLKEDLKIWIKPSSIDQSTNGNLILVDIYLVSKTNLSLDETKEIVYYFFDLLISYYVKGFEDEFINVK